MNFMGPAQSQFESFHELSIHSLDTHWPDWRNYENPQSYVIPPIFTYKRPHKNDQEVENAKDKYMEKLENTRAPSPKKDQVIVCRESDEAEGIVFDAIYELARDKNFGPFLAVQNLNIDRIKTYLGHIFPGIRPGAFSGCKSFLREYDYVLLGPRIGILVIEVKGSNFRHARNFSLNTKSLPDHIARGAMQLQSFEEFLRFLQECSGISTPILEARKILLTPNLERHRFYGWFENLDGISKESVSKKMGNVSHWFKEDTGNSREHFGKPMLYTKLSEAMTTKNGLPQEIFESFGALIAGLASMRIVRNQIEINALKLSEKEAISKEYSLIQAQDPLERLKIPSPTAPSASSSPNMEPNRKRFRLNTPSRVVLLTPDQQKSLLGPNRQFLIGAAGTGKTVVLQAKATQLLQQGKSIVVFAPKNYLNRYRDLFDQQGFQKYEVRSWVKTKFSLLYQADGKDILWNIMCTERSVSEIYKYTEELCESKSQLLIDGLIDWLSNFDAVFIDDACDEEPEGEYISNGYRYGSLCFSLTIMTLAYLKFPQKPVWIALDPYTEGWPIYYDVGFYKRTLNQVIAQSSDTENGYYSCTVFQRVMRCSEKVFHVAYNSSAMEQMVIKPQLGHKIQGSSRSSTVKFGVPSQELRLEMEESWKYIKATLDGLIKQGFAYEQISVIIGGQRQCGSMKVRDYYLEKCREHGIPAVSPQGEEEEKKNGVVINCWDEVSSLEWPIVVYTAIINGALSHEHTTYHKYRACSRATAKLIKIEVIYNSKESDQKGADDQNCFQVAKTVQKVGYWSLDIGKSPILNWALRLLNRHLNIMITIDHWVNTDVSLKLPKQTAPYLTILGDLSDEVADGPPKRKKHKKARYKGCFSFIWRWIHGKISRFANCKR